MERKAYFSFARSCNIRSWLQKLGILEKMMVGFAAVTSEQKRNISLNYQKSTPLLTVELKWLELAGMTQKMSRDRQFEPTMVRMSTINLYVLGFLFRKDVCIVRD